MPRGTYPIKGKYLQQRTVVVGPDGEEHAFSRGTIVTPHVGKSWRVRVFDRHQWGVDMTIIRPSEAAARQWAEASTSVGARWMGRILKDLDSRSIVPRRVDPTVEYRLEVARVRTTRRLGYLPDQDRFPILHGLIRVGDFTLKPRSVPVGVTQDSIGRDRPSWNTLVQVFYREGKSPALRSLSDRMSLYRLSEEEADALTDGVSAADASAFVVSRVGR